MYITRDLEIKIKQYLKSPEIIAIIGPRQSGKTTLIKRIHSELKDAVYLSFEDKEVLDLFNQNVKDFYLLYLKDKRYVFIDEFQYAREGGKNLKYIYDTYKIKIFISGSSAFELTHQAIKYLVGRIFVFHLYPFNFGEFLLAKDKKLFTDFFIPLKELIDKNVYNYTRKCTLPEISQIILNKFLKYYKEYVVYGGYPRVVTAKKEEEKQEILKNIFSLYFLKEIREILRLDTDFELGQLLHLIALQLGSMVSYNELSGAASLNYKQLLGHLNILEKTFIIKKIFPFYTNKRLEITKTPKMYFFDIGLRNAVINNFQKYVGRTDQGMLNENFVASSFINRDQKVNYWRTKSHAEIDFVLQVEDKLYAFEVKSLLTGRKTTKAYYSFKEKYSPRKIVVLSSNYYSKQIKNNIMYIPSYFI